jgi:orotate phosphoribosyltransferase-like protein
LSTEVEQQKEKDRIDWRRSKVQELNSQGYSQREIAQVLQVSNGTVTIAPVAAAPVPITVEIVDKETNLVLLLLLLLVSCCA